MEDSDRSVLALKMKVKLERIISWLSKSGMVVNESKTDLCIFHARDCPQIVVELNGKFIECFVFDNWRLNKSLN